MTRKQLHNSSKRRPKVHRYHHGDLRRALVGEAAKLVAANGHPTITVREIARRLGVTNTAAHYHYPTREALLAAVATRGFEEMTAALEMAMNGATGGASDARSRLGALGDAYVRHALKNG